MFRFFQKNWLYLVTITWFLSSQLPPELEQLSLQLPKTATACSSSTWTSCKLVQKSWIPAHQSLYTDDRGWHLVQEPFPSFKSTHLRSFIWLLISEFWFNTITSNSVKQWKLCVSAWPKLMFNNTFWISLCVLAAVIKMPPVKTISKSIKWKR